MGPRNRKFEGMEEGSEDEECVLKEGKCQFKRVIWTGNGAVIINEALALIYGLVILYVSI